WNFLWFAAMSRQITLSKPALPSYVAWSLVFGIWCFLALQPPAPAGRAVVQKTCHQRRSRLCALRDLLQGKVFIAVGPFVGLGEEVHSHPMRHRFQVGANNIIVRMPRRVTVRQLDQGHGAASMVRPSVDP